MATITVERMTDDNCSYKHYPSISHANASRELVASNMLQQWRNEELPTKRKKENRSAQPKAARFCENQLQSGLARKEQFYLHNALPPLDFDISITRILYIFLSLTATWLILPESSRRSGPAGPCARPQDIYRDRWDAGFREKKSGIKRAAS